MRGNRGEADDGLTWLRDKLHQEGVGVDELLPTPLKLRKQVARLSEGLGDLRSEQEVRDTVAELNHRIMEWRRIPLGPPIFVALVDEEEMVGRWRDGQAATPPPAPLTAPPADAEHQATGTKSVRRRRWYRPRRERP